MSSYHHQRGGDFQHQLALTWDEAYSQGFRCGEERGFALGWDAAAKEA